MQVRGPNFETLVDLDNPHEHLLEAFETSGLQSTNIGRCRRMLHDAIRAKRESGQPIFVSYTSNLVSCGLREVLAQLAKERLVDAFVSTAGGVEEDIIKCLGKTYLGDFALKGSELRLKGINRVGNLLVPNDNYCLFETFFTPVLESILQQQQASRWTKLTTPSDIIAHAGRSMESLPHREESVVYWCAQNNIPLFCPALTDGSIGDMIYFFNFRKKGLVVDPIPDVRRLRAVGSSNSCSMHLVLGGGLPKHHLLRNIKSRKQVVMVSTGLEADGCVSSSSLTDDIAEGLLSRDDDVVRVQGDAAVVVPLLLVGFPSTV